MYIQFTLYTALCVCALFNASPSAVHLVYMHTHAVVVSIAFAACHHPHTHTHSCKPSLKRTLSLSLSHYLFENRLALDALFPAMWLATTRRRYGAFRMFVPLLTSGIFPLGIRFSGPPHRAPSGPKPSNAKQETHQQNA